MNQSESVPHSDKSATAEVACRYILQKSMVAGVIVGARNRKHLASLQKLSEFQLAIDDMNVIQSIVEQSQGPNGPVYDLERDKEGKHGRIMRYNLNEPEA